MRARFPLLFSALILTFSACNKSITGPQTSSADPSSEETLAGKNLTEDAVVVAAQNNEGPHGFVRNEATQEWRDLSDEEHVSFINSNILLLQIKVKALLAKLSKESEDLRKPDSAEKDLQKKLSLLSKTREQLENAEIEYRTRALAYITSNGDITEKSTTQSWVLYGDKNSDPKKTARVFSLDEVRGTYMQVHIQLELSHDLILLKQNKNSTEEERTRVDEAAAEFNNALQKEIKLSDESKDELLTDFTEQSPWLSKK